MTKVAQGENLPAKQEPNNQESGVQNYMPAPQIEATELADIAGAVGKAKDMGDIHKMEVGSINMVTENLDFEDAEGNIIGTPFRRFFCGWTLKMSIDMETGEERGLKLTAILYDPETDKMQTSMAAILVGTIKGFKIKFERDAEGNPPKPVPLQIQCIGRKKTKKGFKALNFKIHILEKSA